MRWSYPVVGLLACLGLAGCATPAIDRPSAEWAVTTTSAGARDASHALTAHPVKMTLADEEAIIARAIGEHEMRRP